jgi:peptide/nickel transport system ATP-binding protein
VSGVPPVPGEVILALRDVVKSYPRRGLLGLVAERPPPAVDGVSLEIRRGDVLGLIGESGSGKTTLARLALGLLRPDAGDVLLFGEHVHRLGAAGRRRLRKRAQMLLQSPDASLNPGSRVLDLLVESARLHQPDRNPIAVAQEVAARVGILHRLSGWPHELSGGEKRRVGIARLLVADPELIVADEPTSGLDAALKADIADLLLAGRRSDRAYVIISHDLPLVLYAATRVAVMVGGRIVEIRDMVSFGQEPQHPYTRRLLASSGMTGAGLALAEDRLLPLDPPDVT